MAITVENSNISFPATATTQLNTSIRFGNVPDRYLVVAISTRSNTVTANTVIWQPAASAVGEQAMTLIGAISHPTQALRTELWGLLAPTASSSTTSRVGVTYSAAGIQTTIGVTIFAGVSQIAPYPGYPATYGADSSIGTAISGNTTAAEAVNSAAGNVVLTAIAKDMSVVTDRLNPGTGICDRTNRISGASAAAAVQGGFGTIPATGASTNVSWTFLQTTGGALNGRSYAQFAVPLQHTTSVAPYYVEPPFVRVRTQNSGLGGAAFPTSNNAAFASSGAIAVGPQPQNLTSTRIVTYSSKVVATQSTFNLGAGGSGTFQIGDPVWESASSFHDVGTAGTTAIARIPTTAAVDDIAIVAIYTEDEAFDVQPAVGGAFTEIATSTSANFRLRTFYRRLIGGDPGSSFTFNVATASGEYRLLNSAIYRGCVTSGSPIGSGAAAATTATGTSTTPTATGLTTTQADMTVVMVHGTFDDRTVTSPSFLDERLETGRNLWLGDSAVLTASATGNQSTTVTTSTAWGAQLFALIPATGSATLARAASSTQLRGMTISRATSDYGRAVLRTAAAISHVPKRNGSIIRRTAARTTAAMTMTADKTLTLWRDALTTMTRSMVAIRSPGTFSRTVARIANTPAITVIRVLIPGVGGVFNRTAAATMTRLMTNKRTGSIYNRTRARTTAAHVTAAVRKLTVRRTATRTGSVVITLKRSGSVHRRTVTRVGTLGIVVVQSVSGVSISFFDYGTPNATVLQVIDPAHYSGFQFYWEASFRSNTVGQIAYCHLFNVTTGLVVAGSQITTVSPHHVVQVVRSGPISLIAGTYKARFGRGTGYFVIPGEARLIGETTL